MTDQSRLRWQCEHGISILMPCPTCEPFDSPYEPCSRCAGHGLVDGMSGPDDCRECGGSGYVRARDERGRFTRVPLGGTE